MAQAKRKQSANKKVSREWVLNQAETMLAAYETVEVERFDLTLATETRQAVEFVPGLTITKLRRALPSLFDRNEREHLNFIIRPRFGKEHRLVQLDDLDAPEANQICLIASWLSKHRLVTFKCGLRCRSAMLTLRADSRAA